MRTLSAAFLAALQAHQVYIAELYTLTLTDGTVYRYTSHAADIVWDAAGNTYKAIPISRDVVVFTTNFESSGVGVSLAAAALDVYSKLHANVLEGATLEIRLIRWNTAYTADEQFIIYSGFVDIDFDRKTLELSVRSQISMLTMQMPKYVYEEPCNWSLFDSECGLLQADFAFSGTAADGTQTTVIDTNRGSVFLAEFDGGDSANPIARGGTITGGVNGYTAKVVQVVYLTASTGLIYYVQISNSANFVNDEVLTAAGKTVTVNGTPAADSTFYEMGEIKMTSGANAGQRRQIVLESEGTITVAWPFPEAVATGDTYLLYPGCDKRPDTCVNRLGNGNFRGFLYVPGVEEIYS
ncbi:MAG: DUF2163 domain-containing protein [Planctomycetaceae bacterium]|nr:DUF2163 domain-containing protein [Planctomycetaceae bacterium]